LTRPVARQEFNYDERFISSRIVSCFAGRLRGSEPAVLGELLNVTFDDRQQVAGLERFGDEACESFFLYATCVEIGNER
jgi:hypothetical protein